MVAKFTFSFRGFMKVNQSRTGIMKSQDADSRVIGSTGIRFYHQFDGLFFCDRVKLKLRIKSLNAELNKVVSLPSRVVRKKSKV